MTDEGPRIYRDIVQGTEPWARLRAGIPTASQFHRIMTPSGKPSKSQDMYRLELLAERLTGEPTVEATSHWMDRGSELEAEAVACYELQRDMDTTKVGFVTNAAGTIGASPDRLVGEDGLLEIKVGKPATHVGYLLEESAAYEDYKIQAQAQLWVTGRQWNDLMAYHPWLPPAIHRVVRDEAFIRIMAAEVETFSAVLEKQFEFCKMRGWLRERPPSRSTLPPLDTLVATAAMKGIMP